MVKQDDFEKDIRAIFKQTVIWRRHLHQHPELSHEEFKTADYIEAVVHMIDDTLIVERLLPTTLQVKLVGKQPGKHLLFRADIDALAVTEQTNLAFASNHPEIMHACGHDGHTAILLSVLNILANYRQELHGTIVFIFQAAEEVGGARQLIKTDFLNDIDEAYALHLWPMLKTGKYQLSSGPIMAAGSWFRIRILGNGGHAGRPHQTIDPINASLDLISSIKAQLTRKLDPLMTHAFSITYIHAGEATNVFPNDLTFGGTIRTLDQDALLDIRTIILESLSSFSTLYGFNYQAKFEIDALGEDDAPSAPLVNDRELTEQLRDLLQKEYGDVVEAFIPTLAGEDFSFYGLKVPVVFTFVGAAPEGQAHGLHHSQFDFDEDAMIWGIRLFLTKALTMIGEKN